MRRDNPRHVLNAERVHAHLDHGPRRLNKVLGGVQGAHGVDDSALGVAAPLLDSLDRGLDIAHIIKRVKYPDNVDAVL